MSDEQFRLFLSFVVNPNSVYAMTTTFSEPFVQAESAKDLVALIHGAEHTKRYLLRQLAELLGDPEMAIRMVNGDSNDDVSEDVVTDGTDTPDRDSV